MLLPKNVERRQWVNRNHRLKVVFNVAGCNPMPHSAKALRMEETILFRMLIMRNLFMCIQAPSFVGGAFLLLKKGVEMLDSDSSSYRYNSFVKKQLNMNLGFPSLPLIGERWVSIERGIHHGKIRPTKSRRIYK